MKKKKVVMKKLKKKLKNDVIIIGEKPPERYLRSILKSFDFRDYVRLQSFREQLWKVKEIKVLLENVGVIENTKREIVKVPMKVCPTCNATIGSDWQKHMVCGTEFKNKKLKKTVKESIIIELEKIDELKKFIK